MAENRDRRDRLRDAALGVLAAEGGRGLTHRAVDAAAGVPSGTAKNYFPTRDALLRAVADRCLEQYLAIVDRLRQGPPEGAPAPPPGRAGVELVLGSLLADVAGPGRARLTAMLELHAEAVRRPWLSETLGRMADSDLLLFEQLLRGAGLTAAPEQVRALVLAMQSAVLALLAYPPSTQAGLGLDDPPGFVRALLAAVCPPG